MSLNIYYYYYSTNPSDFISGAVSASSPTGAAPSSQSSGRTRNAETARTMSPEGHVCPSARRCCCARTYAPIQIRCAAHPRCGSTGPHTCPPTMSPPAWFHGRSGQSAHPTCRPTWTTHRPLTAQPTCQCTWCFHRCRRTSRPTCSAEGRVGGFLFEHATHSMNMMHKTLKFVVPESGINHDTSESSLPFMPNMSMPNIQWCIWIQAAPFISPFFSFTSWIIMLKPLLLPLLPFPILSPLICSLLHMHNPTGVILQQIKIKYSIMFW